MSNIETMQSVYGAFGKGASVKTAFAEAAAEGRSKAVQSN